MPQVSQLYRMHDADPRGVFPVDGKDAQSWNRKGHGIFWTVNRFKTAERRIENLERIEAWAVDMDVGTKPEMLAKLESSPLIPSLVVETKRGFQAYWRAKDGQPAHWNAIVFERLVPFYGADKNARDIARILRVPGYLHLKVPTEPFLVRTVFTRSVSYSEEQVAYAYPAVEQERKAVEVQREIKRTVTFKDSDDFWDRAFQLDCEEGLRRLSGSAEVGGERYDFRRTSNGNLNILVDGKSTSTWIDKRGKIGSLNRGGPGLAQWLHWFGMSYADIAKTLKRLYPQLEAR